MIPITILFVGDAGSGKTTYFNRLITGDFTHNHTPTLDYAENTLVLSTNCGVIKFTIRDSPSHPMPAGSDVNGIIGFYYKDSSNMDMIRNITLGNNTCMHTVACQTHIDRLHIDLHSPDESTTKFQCNKDVLPLWDDHIRISSKSNYELHKPLLMIASKILKTECREQRPEMPEIP